MNRNARKADEKIKQVIFKFMKSEIVELYRVINFYDGKLKGMEMDLKVYEEKFLRIGK